MTSLKGKVIAITGAASGMGLAIAKLLASHGAYLSLSDIQEGPLSSLPEMLASTSSLNSKDILTRVVDVRNREQVEAWIAATTEHFGRPLDGAVNSAGDFGKSSFTEAGLIRNLTDEEYDYVMDVNAKGILNCLRAQLRDMKVGQDGKGGGSIVNISSVAGLTGSPQLAPYSASKHAVIGLTRSAAKEEGERAIRVNAIAPGYIMTPMVTRVSEMLGSAATMSPKELGQLGRMGTAEEVAQLVCFLLGDESSFITGSVYTIDGGLSC